MKTEVDNSREICVQKLYSLVILVIACDTVLLQINPIIEKAPKNANNTFNFLAGTAKFIYLLLLEVVV